MSVSVNPPNSEVPPLKAAIKSTNSKMVEFLVSRGAYYIYMDVFNNLNANSEENHKYATLCLPNQQGK